MGSSDFCKIPINFVLKHGMRMPFDIFIRLSESKMVKLSHKDDLDGMIKRYKEKGVTDLFVKKSDFEEYVQGIDQNLTKQFFNESEKSGVKELIDTLEDAHSVLKESLIKIGVQDAVISIAKQCAVASLKLMESVPSVFKFLKDFKETNNSHFLHSLLVGYTASCIVDTFPWQSQGIKEKITMASLIADVFLEEEDIEILDKWELGEIQTKDLYKRILSHNEKLVEVLTKSKASVFPNEVITIVAQHHERPDGSGFPGKLPHSKVILLSCIHIIAYNFIVLMNRYDFEVDMKEEILENLQKRFNLGNYKKAVTALTSMFH